MLDTTVPGEVEDGLLAENGRVEIARMDQKLVALGAGLRDDLAVGIDDQAACNEWKPSSTPALATATTHVEF